LSLFALYSVQYMNLHGKRSNKTIIGRFGWFAKLGFGGRLEKRRTLERTETVDKKFGKNRGWFAKHVLEADWKRQEPWKEREPWRRNSGKNGGGGRGNLGTEAFWDEE
jgi:hypothetical protein